MFDPFPIGHAGELNDLDMYDAAGALMLPVDRYRRFVTPIDIDGTGRINPWTTSSETLSATNFKATRGADVFGRVLFSSYFRPPGAPGVISSNNTVVTGSGGMQYTSPDGSTLGAIYYPVSPVPAVGSPNHFYTSGPNPAAITGGTAGATVSDYLPDSSTNPLHGFESYKIPNIYTTTTNGPPVTMTTYTWSPGSNGGIAMDQGAIAPTASVTGIGIPGTYQTYDAAIHDDGLNDANELNLYNPNPLFDSPFTASDLEWLYRQQDVDGASLSSRLAQLAPVSFTNTIDGQRRRRLFALDTLGDEQLRLGQRQSRKRIYQQ